MDFYIARQPIFTANKKLHAYELLYRGYKDYSLAEVSGNKATTSILSSVFLTEGFSVISDSKPCFINFTEDLLIKKIPYTFPKSQVVVEILEDVRPTKAVVEAIRSLKADGYVIALDDFVFKKKLEPLIASADIIKVDVRLTPLDSILKTLRYLSRFKVKLLAEKVESIDEFEKANKLGFDYFQGYFFSKPEKILLKELASVKMTLLSLMAEVARKSTTLDRLHFIISKDLAISYKLLRFLNSAYFYRVELVKSVKHAIAYLGEKELRRFLLLVIVAELAVDKPSELVRLSLVRAKFCELLARHSILAEYDLEIFMVGMFSFMDTMLETEMSVIMDKLPVSEAVRDALVHGTGMFSPFLDATIAYERRQENRFVEIMQECSVDSSTVPELYLEAVKYANGLL